MTRRMLFAVALLALAWPAAAHQIWLERDGNLARAYFGEPVENLREKSGGLLDRILNPRAFGRDASSPLPLRRAEDHFSIALAEGTGDVRLVENSLPPFGPSGSADRTKTVMLAREGRSETRQVLELELVPLEAGGTEFTLLLRGQPLPRAEVTLVAPPRWERKLRTDAQGRVRFETPWSGRYVAEATHTEATPGGAGEDAYARLRYVSTLSFTVGQGIPWVDR